MKEIWKPIQGYDGLYEISNLGRVKSLPKQWVSCNKNPIMHKERILKSTSQQNKYAKVVLRKDLKSKTHYIHRLVADAFIIKDPNRIYVDHIDGNKQNNIFKNLRWCTHEENIHYAFKINKNK